MFGVLKKAGFHDNLRLSSGQPKFMLNYIRNTFQNLSKEHDWLNAPPDAD